MLFNIDWLEVFCIEPKAGIQLNAEYFRRAGYQVKVREYGTKVYQEMFTIKIGEIWAIEIRRNPYAVKGQGGIMQKGSCHIRLTNEACYVEHPTELMRDFISSHNYTYKGISRVDVCADFQRFQGGLKPTTFIEKYMKRDILRVNKGKFAFHGNEQWSGREVQTLSWGCQTSMVSTKIYNKSVEMREMKPKQHIKAQWNKVGLETDYKGEDVWRVEFSIKTRCKNWIRCENECGKKIQLEYIAQCLDNYSDKEHLAILFFSLAKYYFEFRVAEQTKSGEWLRKARCKKYNLFDNETEILKPIGDVKVLQTTRTEKILLNYLERLKDDPRGSAAEGWEMILAQFTMIISKAKAYKEVNMRHMRAEQAYTERQSKAYKDFYTTLKNGSMWVLEPEWDKEE